MKVNLAESILPAFGGDTVLVENVVKRRQYTYSATTTRNSFVASHPICQCLDAFDLGEKSLCQVEVYVFPCCCGHRLIEQQIKLGIPSGQLRLHHFVSWRKFVC